MAGSRWVHVGVAALLAAATSTIAGVIHQVGASGATVSSFVPIAPCRLADTRPEPGVNVGTRATPLGAQETHTFTVWGINGNCTIPTTATGITANVTSVNPTAAGFLTLWPADVTQPLTSNLNYMAGSPPTPNSVTVRLSANGQLNTFNSAGTVHVIIDIVGYFVASAGGAAGPTGPTGPAGATGPAGPPGPAAAPTRISPAQIGMLRWDQDPGRPATIAVGGGPQGVGFDGTNIWVANATSRTLTKIDPRANAVLATIDVPGSPTGIAFDGAHIWVALAGIPSRATKIDPVTNSIVAHVPVGANPQGLVFDGTNLWVANSGSNSVTRIDPVANAVVATVSVEAFPTALAFDGTSIWVTSYTTNSMSKIDRATNTTTAVPVGSVTSGVAFDGFHLWIAMPSGSRVMNLNPATNTGTVYIDVGLNPHSVVFDGTSIWVPSLGADRVTRIDVVRETVTATLAAGDGPSFAAFDGTSVWVSNQVSGTVTKLRADW